MRCRGELNYNEYYSIFKISLRIITCFLLVIILSVNLAAPEHASGMNKNAEVGGHMNEKLSLPK